MTKKPFTLIELLTVIAVIAIISAMTLPTLLNQSSAQLLRAGNRQLRSAMIATRSYAVEHQMAASLYIYNYKGDDGDYTAMQMYIGSDLSSSGDPHKYADSSDLPTTILMCIDENLVNANYCYTNSVDSDKASLDPNVNSILESTGNYYGYLLTYYPNGTMSKSSNPAGNMWGSIKIMAEGAEAATDVYRGLEINKLTNAVRVYGP